MLYLQKPGTRPCSETDESSLRSKNLSSKFQAYLRLSTLFSLLLNGMLDAFIICRMIHLSLNHCSY
jgi:hypothetical protein